VSDVATKTPRTPGDEKADAVARLVVDAALGVNRAIGPGFVESVYEEALAHEFGLRGIGFVRQPVVETGYRATLWARADSILWWAGASSSS
jgi:hypothetical protein